MPYTVQVECPFRAIQGLVSSVRAEAGLPSLDAADGRPFVLRVGLLIAEAAVANTTGRAVDSDTVSVLLQNTARELAAHPWTTLFDFRPSLERVSRYVFDSLAAELLTLSYVEIDDPTAGLVVRYQP